MSFPGRTCMFAFFRKNFWVFCGRLSQNTSKVQKDFQIKNVCRVWSCSQKNWNEIRSTSKLKRSDEWKCKIINAFFFIFFFFVLLLWRVLSEFILSNVHNWTCILFPMRNNWSRKSDNINDKLCFFFAFFLAFVE